MRQYSNISYCQYLDCNFERTGDVKYIILLSTNRNIQSVRVYILISNHSYRRCNTTLLISVVEIGRFLSLMLLYIITSNTTFNFHIWACTNPSLFKTRILFWRNKHPLYRTLTHITKRFHTINMDNIELF